MKVGLSHCVAVPAAPIGSNPIRFRCRGASRRRCRSIRSCMRAGGYAAQSRSRKHRWIPSFNPAPRPGVASLPGRHSSVPGVEGAHMRSSSPLPSQAGSQRLAAIRDDDRGHGHSLHPCPFWLHRYVARGGDWCAGVVRAVGTRADRSHRTEDRRDFGPGRCYRISGRSLSCCRIVGSPCTSEVGVLSSRRTRRAFAAWEHPELFASELL